MGLVLTQTVPTLDQLGHCPHNLWNELRELEEWQHRLRANLPHKVGAASTVVLDQLDVGGEAFLDFLVFLKATLLLVGEERERLKARSEKKDAEDDNVLLVALTAGHLGVLTTAAVLQLRREVGHQRLKFAKQLENSESSLLRQVLILNMEVV